ncbi:MAG: hypothetical protein LBI05_09155 [Planctomycetaceae bacterium]|jgi:hypothetical protein|nr:hypothetical protein [Planctomycetaceae bacterium]
MRNTYIIIIGLFMSAGVLAVNFLPTCESDSCLFHDQTASLSLLLPNDPDFPSGVPAEASPLVGQNLLGGTGQVTAPPLDPLVPVQQTAPAQVQESSGTTPPASVSYVYFYTGVPVWSVPNPNIVYSGGPAVAPTMPVVQPPYSVPVFVPQVVPSRVGSPKLVYSNGVVVKPKVYFPRQPLRNSVRGVTP